MGPCVGRRHWMRHPSILQPFENSRAITQSAAESLAGIREFREKLASYLLEAEVPLAITRHAETIAARRKRSQAERTALKEAAVRLQQLLAAEGISEEEVLKDFK